MPSSSPRRPSRNRCRYQEDGRRCVRNATTSGLCGAHQSVAEQIEEERVGSIGDMIDRLIHGQSIPRSTLEQAVADVASRITGRTFTREEIVDLSGDAEIDWEVIYAKVSDGAHGFSQRVRSAAGRTVDPQARAQREQERARRAQERADQRARDQKARERAGHVSRARRILGYTAKEPITKEMVKQRHRELARKHHPDRGGSVQRMQEINWAVEILLAPG